MKTVSLVLGSGGARGLAHIGVIHWLEKNGYTIKSISGCSIGALVGGVYAAGKLDEFEEWVRAVSKIDILKLLDISWSKNGLVKGDKIIDTLVALVGEQKIEDLPIRYTAVAVDVENEKEIWLTSGCLFDAIRASISLPLLFTPYDYNGLKLIDGGVLNPVPIAPTFNDDTDITIAVNLGGEKLEKTPKQVSGESQPSGQSSSSVHDKIAVYINQFQRSFDKNSEHDMGAYDIANKAFDAMQSTIAGQKLAAYPPDKIIEIARNNCGILEFDRADEMITLGFEKAREHLS